MNTKQLQGKSLSDLTAMYWAYNDAYQITGDNALLKRMEDVDKAIDFVMNEMEEYYENNNSNR